MNYRGIGGILAMEKLDGAKAALAFLYDGNGNVGQLVQLADNALQSRYQPTLFTGFRRESVPGRSGQGARPIWTAGVASPTPRIQTGRATQS